MRARRERLFRTWLPTLAAGAVLLAAPAAVAEPPAGGGQADPAPEAGEGDGLVWKAHYLPLHWSELVIAGAFAGGFLLVELLMETPEEPRWEGGILFDDAVREWLVAGDPDARDTADVFSDIFWYLGEAYPLVDAVFVAGVAHERWDVTWQLTAMWLESTAIIGFLSRLTQRGIARERPLAGECGDDPEYSPLCFTRAANTAFISGHTAGPMMSAGQTCAVHQFLDLYESDAAGALACAANVTLGLLAGIMRIVTDRHWVTDVLAGGALGFAVGYFVPWLHFTLREPESSAGEGQGKGDGDRDGGLGEAGLLFTPWADQESVGVGVIGFW